MTRGELNDKIAALDPTHPLTIGTPPEQAMREIRDLKELVKALGGLVVQQQSALDSLILVVGSLGKEGYEVIVKAQGEHIEWLTRWVEHKFGPLPVRTTT